MYRQNSQWLSVSLVALWSLATSLSVSGHEAAKHVIEAEQKILITQAFDHSDYLYGSGIRIAVYEGKATLSGKVENAVNRDLAKQLALGITGITLVDNRLVVVPGYMAVPTPSPRSYTQMVTRAEAGAVSIARGKAETVISAEEPAGWGVADGWISIRVRLAFMYSDTIDSDHISVQTRNSIVILRGHVTDGAGYALAVARARNIPGVKGINASDFFHTPAGKHNSVGDSASPVFD